MTNEELLAKKHVGKLGSVTRSPIQGKEALIRELASYVNALDEMEEWPPLIEQYVRDFIQGMWICQSMKDYDLSIEEDTNE